MKVRAALGSDVGLKGKRRKGRSRAGKVTLVWIAGCVARRFSSIIPFDLSSFVHPLSNSWTSSGSTSFRNQASAQRGFGGGGGALPLRWDCFLFLEVEAAGSLLRNREKKGIFGRRVVECSIAVGVDQSIQAIERMRIRTSIAYGASVSDVDWINDD